MTRSNDGQTASPTERSAEPEYVDIAPCNYLEHPVPAGLERSRWDCTGFFINEQA